MDERYAIVEARPEHVPALARIERAAGQLLAAYAPASVLAATIDEVELHEAQAEGRLWVALLEDAPVGFALVIMLTDTAPHLEEIDVDPVHGRRGVGAALVRAVCEWASRRGHREVTLTTFREPPWNMPFYARLGFEEMPAEQWTAELAAIVRDEAARGLDPKRRVAMRCRPERSMRP